MAKGLVRLVSLSLSFFILMVPIAVGDTGGYVVRPVDPDTISGTPYDPVPITFWQLSPRAMAIAVALSILPMLVFPIEILYALKILAWLGYRKISQNAIFQNQNRLMIFELIKANPGIDYRTLSQLVGLKRGSVRYHLSVLALKGETIEVNYLNSIGYFENTGKFTEFEKKMFNQLQNGTNRKIMTTLIVSPNVSRRDLVRRIGIAGPSVTWHTNRLSRSNIISMEKNGRDVQYNLTKESYEFFEKFPRFFFQNFSPKTSPGKL